MNESRGLTLIELLVVIAIIAVLMAILMPAMSYVRKQARAGACQSNLRQMALAMNLYTIDYEDLTGDGGYGSIGVPSYPHAQGYFMGRFRIDRHNGAINLGFVDTHVDRVPLKELWTRKWHHRFIPNLNVSVP